MSNLIKGGGNIDDKRFTKEKYLTISIKKRLEIDQLQLCATETNHSGLLNHTLCWSLQKYEGA